MERVGKKQSKLTKPILWILLIIVAIVQIFPLIWLFDFSLASSTEMFTSGLLIIPEKIQWGNYVKAFV
ncbi:MAG: carbohydrate ABC transporter permease, partial [Coprococcus sp.]